MNTRKFLVAFFLCVCSLRALTDSASYNGISWTGTWTLTGTTNNPSGSQTLAYTWNVTITGGTSQVYFIYQKVNASNNAVISSSEILRTSSGTGNITIEIADGQKAKIAIYGQNSSSGFDSGVIDEQVWTGQPCPIVAYDKWIDNRTGQTGKEWRVRKGSGTGSVVVDSGTVAAGQWLHYVANIQTCEGIYLEIRNGENWLLDDGDPAVVTETREPDPPPVTPPTITDPTTTPVAPVPTPTPSFAQRVTDGGMVEERNSAGTQQVMIHAATSMAIAAKNSQSSAQADAYNAQRLASIDANIAILRRNSDEVRADRAANNGRLDNIVTNTKKTADKLTSIETKLGKSETVNDRINEAADDSPDETSASAFVASQQAAGEAVIGQLESFGDTGSGVSAGPNMSSDFWTVTFGSFTFDVNPDRPEIQAVGQWFKALIAWLALIGYIWWAYNELEDKIKLMASVPQIRGNNAPGGIGGPATLLLAGITCLVIFTAIPLIWAVALTPGIPVNAISGGSQVLTAATGAVGGALYLFWYFFPVAYLVTLLVHQYAFRKFAMVIWVGAIIAIKSNPL
jgi:hypothetical protein